MKRRYSLNIDILKKPSGHPNIQFNVVGKTTVLLSDSRGNEAAVALHISMVPSRTADSNPLIFSFIEKTSKLVVLVHIDAKLRTQKLTPKGINAWMNLIKVLRLYADLVDLSKVAAVQMSFNSKSIDDKNKLLLKLFCHLICEKCVLISNHMSGYRVTLMTTTHAKIRSCLEEVAAFNKQFFARRRKLCKLTADKAAEIFLYKSLIQEKKSLDDLSVFEDGDYLKQITAHNSYKIQVSMLEPPKEQDTKKRGSVRFLEIPITATATRSFIKPQNLYESRLEASFNRASASNTVYFEELINMLEDNKVNLKSLRDNKKTQRNSMVQVPLAHQPQAAPQKLVKFNNTVVNIIYKAEKMFFVVCFELDSRSFLDVARRYSLDNRQAIESLVVKCKVDISAPRARNIVKNQNISYRPKVQELIELLGLDSRGKAAFERLFLGSGILSNVKAYLIDKIRKKLGSCC